MSNAGSDGDGAPPPVPGTSAARGRPGRPTDGDRGQSSVVGVALMLSLVVIGASLVVVFGQQAIESTQQSATVARAEQSMTALDSDAAVVALGEATSKSTTLSDAGDGRYLVNETAGSIRITHYNYSENNDTELLYEGTLGAVEYHNGETVLAYQGGGVWRKQGNGSTMVSSPEFYYRGATLTLPVIRVEGDGTASTSPQVSTEKLGVPLRAFPDADQPYTGGNKNYTNPVSNGTVSVTVESDYYRAWADYFRTRTTGNVTVDHGNETATVDLTAPGIVGDFRLPHRTEALELQGLSGGHPVDRFDLTLKPNTNFNNLYFSFYVEKGAQEFEMLVHVPGGIGGGACNDGTLTGDDPDDMEMDIYYYDGEGTHHKWTNGSVTPLTGGVHLQCDGSGNVELDVDYTASTTFTYGSFTTTQNPANWYYDDTEGTLGDPAWFNHSVDGEPLSYDPDAPASSRQESLNHLVNHYFGVLGPSFDLRVDYGTGGSSRPDPDISFGYLGYERNTSDYYITYLHVTENRVRVEVD